jgi:hypothetical protein
MDMKKQTERELQRQSRWQEVVRGQSLSGQSVRAYCKAAGIEESAFYWWRRELAQRGLQRGDRAPTGSGWSQNKDAQPQGKASRPTARDTRQDKAVQARSQPVQARTKLVRASAASARQGKLAGPSGRRSPPAVAEVGFLPVRVAAARGAEAGHTIEIILGDNLVLRIPAGFDRQTLADVLSLLEGRSC